MLWDIARNGGWEIDHEGRFAYHDNNMLMLLTQNRSTSATVPLQSHAGHLRQAAIAASLMGLLLLGMYSPSFAAIAAPLPPARPVELLRDTDEPDDATPQEAETSEPPQIQTEAGEEESLPLPPACAALAEAGIIIATPVQNLTIPRPCAMPQPVNLSAVRLDDGHLIALKPGAIMSCDMVVAIAEWTREDLAPSIDSLGAKLETLKVASSFSCRGRNRKASARTSEHGFGNAMDVGGFELSDGRTVSIAPNGMPKAFALAMKESACARFTTVLGPGSDGYHETHIHVDLAKRRNGFKLCRWKLPGSTTPERMYVRTTSPSAPTSGAGETQVEPPSTHTAAAPMMQEDAPLPPRKPRMPDRSTNR